MKIMWCWRCKCEVGMLNEEEYLLIHNLYGECMDRAKEIRRNSGSSLEKIPLNDIFKPVSELYEKITGFKDFHQ